MVGNGLYWLIMVHNGWWWLVMVDTGATAMRWLRSSTRYVYGWSTAVITASVSSTIVSSSIIHNRLRGVKGRFSLNHRHPKVIQLVFACVVHTFWLVGVSSIHGLPCDAAWFPSNKHKGLAFSTTVAVYPMAHWHLEIQQSWQPEPL